MEDPYPYSKECDYKTSIVKSILNTGYVIGRNMVITGIAISSAPIVVPPLVAFSAIGFAFSVPFGFVFATYACTNKIMSTILPIPPSPLILNNKCRRVENGYYFDEYDEYDGREVEDLVTNGYEDDEEMEDLNQGVDIVFELDEGGGDGYGKQGEGLIMNMDENSGEESSHAKSTPNDGRETEDRTSTKVVFGSEIFGAVGTQNGCVVQRENDIIEEEEKGKTEENGQMEDERKEKVMVKEIESNRDFVALPAFKRRPLVTDNRKAAYKSKTSAKMPSKEDILDEERIWEKIGAMKTIVGYKAPRQSACVGELKALYMFTGVEPPTSFKDDSDLNEVNAKLKFLMTVVGVK